MFTIFKSLYIVLHDIHHIDTEFMNVTNTLILTHLDYSYDISIKID